jgi:dephospho-CoA kinase
MKRVLLTGMSGVGKSTVIRELARLGYKAIDLDEPGWSELVNVSSHPGLSTSATAQDWLWREDRIQDVLDLEDADVLFLSGCAPNQVKFYSRFDHIVLLSAPVPLTIERLATRTTNPYGKQPDELALVLHDKQTVEPMLRSVASLEVDTSVSLARVVETVVGLARAGAGGCPAATGTA